MRENEMIERQSENFFPHKEECYQTENRPDHVKLM